MNGSRKPIVSLTYDGAQLCHVETVVPHLDQHGLFGTFFADPLPLLDSLPLWRAAVKKGHEVANGCLIGSIDVTGGMESWSPEMIEDDIDETDRMLTEVFPGQPVFSFGYPISTGGAVGIGHLRRIVEQRHSVCRSGEHGTNNIDSPNLNYLKCIHLDNVDIEHIKSIMVHSIETSEWLILAVDGVGSGEPAIDASTHFEMCEWLAHHQDTVDVMTLTQASERAHGLAERKLRLL